MVLAVTCVEDRTGDGAVVVLVDGRHGYEPVYLAGGAPGREVWVRTADAATVYSNLKAAQRAALLAHRRPGRSQPYAIPRRLVEDTAWNAPERSLR